MQLQHLPAISYLEAMKRSNNKKELLLSRLRKPSSHSVLIQSGADDNNDKLIEALTATGQMIGKLLLTLFTIGALTILIMGFPDSNLLPTKETVALPFAGPASLKAVLIGLPIIMIGVRIYIEIYLRNWTVLESKRKERGIEEPLTVSPLRQPVLKVFTWFILYPLVPVRQ